MDETIVGPLAPEILVRPISNLVLGYSPIPGQYLALFRL